MSSAENGAAASAGNKFMAPRYHLLLPHKERFSPANAGAVATIAADLVRQNPAPNTIRIFGTPVDTPFDGCAFTPLSIRHRWWHGGNIGFAEAYLHQLDDLKSPDLVEVHGRCHVAAHIKARRPDLKVALYLHNDPRRMKGAITPDDRTRLLHDLSAVICISDYIRQCFLDGVDAPAELIAKTHTARNGVERLQQTPVPKKRMVLFVGRMVAEKGALELAEAAARVLPQYPGWHLCLAGAKGFEVAAKSPYEKRVATVLAGLGKQAQMTGFLPISDIRALQDEAAIIACPSIWQEPMGKTVLEALAAGSAVLTSRRGGIPEVAEGRAHIVDEPNADTLTTALDRLIADDVYRAELQKSAWADFPFTAIQMATDAASARRKAIAPAFDSQGHGLDAKNRLAVMRDL